MARSSLLSFLYSLILLYYVIGLLGPSNTSIITPTWSLCERLIDMPKNSQKTQVWKDGRLNRDILAFVILLTIRKGGQISPDDLKEVEEGEPEQPSNDDEYQSWLKESFCDRFAEFVSKYSYGSHVTSSAVHDNGKHARIIVARNSGFTRADQDSLRQFEEKWHDCAKSTEGT